MIVIKAIGFDTVPSTPVSICGTFLIVNPGGPQVGLPGIRVLVYSVVNYLVLQSSGVISIAFLYCVHVLTHVPNRLDCFSLFSKGLSLYFSDI